MTTLASALAPAFTGAVSTSMLNCLSSFSPAGAFAGTCPSAFGAPSLQATTKRTATATQAIQRFISLSSARFSRVQNQVA
jgi:hypothetical protein